MCGNSRNHCHSCKTWSSLIGGTHLLFVAVDKDKHGVCLGTHSILLTSEAYHFSLNKLLLTKKTAFCQQSKDEWIDYLKPLFCASSKRMSLTTIISERHSLLHAFYCCCLFCNLVHAPCTPQMPHHIPQGGRRRSSIGLISSLMQRQTAKQVKQ